MKPSHIIISCLANLLLVTNIFAGDNVYTCKINDVFEIKDSGEKVRHLLYEQFINSNLIYNTNKNSLLRCKNKKCKNEWANMKLVQSGSRVNSLKAIQIKEGTGSTVLGVIKINTRKSNLPFLYWDDGANLWAVGACTL